MPTPLIAYLVRRTGTALLVLFIISIIVFVLLHLLPGGAVLAILGSRATPAQISALTHQLGYDRPLPIQFVVWVSGILHGNLGYSYKLNSDVTTLLAQRLPKTILLTASSTVVALVIALPLGILQALRRNTIVDYVFTGVTFILYAIPSFFLGLILILWFAIDIPLFPASAPQSNSFSNVLVNWRGMVLPVLTLALLTIAFFSRYMRSAVMDNLTQDYVRTVRAKGASDRRIMLHHVLRNALIPVVTLLGLSLPMILAGAVVTEAVFNFPGMGLLAWQAAQNRDYPVLLGTTLIVGLATVMGSLLADVGYALLDPRIRLGST